MDIFASGYHESVNGDRINTMKDEDKTKKRLIEELKELREKTSAVKTVEAEHKNTLEALLESENLYKMIFESANDGIIIHDAEGHIFDVNQTMYKRLGYTKQELIKMSLNGLVTPEFAEKITERMSTLKKDGVAIFESADIRKDGTVMPVEVNARFINYKGQKIILSVVRDINERKLAEDLIMSTYRENEIIRDEIKRQAIFDHEIISRILEFLHKKLEKETIKTDLQAVKNRIKTIDFIKRRLYNSPSLLRINISNPIEKLISYSYSLYCAGIKNIRVKREIQDVNLDLDKAIPCALIINELLSNSLKHAFPNDLKGEIVISLNKSECGTQILHFKDNGIGFPETIDFRNTTTLGMQIVMNLVDQLDGEIEIRRKPGTEFILQF
jgi:PAS domain S-box-containing protein